MNPQFPDPKTRQILERGISIFRNGLQFEEELAKATGRGYRSAS